MARGFYIRKKKEVTLDENGNPVLKKESKYKNKKVTINGITYDSKIEGKRGDFLIQMQKDGVIKNLQRQVPYELIPAVVEQQVKHLKTKDKIIERTLQRKTVYKADFEYDVVSSGRHVVEDVKGSEKIVTPDFKLKKKLMFYKYRINVELVFKANKPIEL